MNCVQMAGDTIDEFEDQTEKSSLLAPFTNDENEGEKNDREKSNSSNKNCI